MTNENYDSLWRKQFTLAEVRSGLNVVVRLKVGKVILTELLNNVVRHDFYLSYLRAKNVRII